MNMPVERSSFQISLMILTVLLLVNSINGQPKEYIREPELTYLKDGKILDQFSPFLKITPPSAIWNVKNYKSQVLKDNQDLFVSSKPAGSLGQVVFPGNYWLTPFGGDKAIGQTFLEVLPSNTQFNLRFSVGLLSSLNYKYISTDLQVYLLGADGQQPMTFRKQYAAEEKFTVYQFNEKFKTPPNSKFKSINFAPVELVGYFFTNIYLTEIVQILCTDGQNLVIISGQKSCVPDDVIAQSANCFKFQKIPGTTTGFQCGQCDTSALSYQLVNITGGYKGCIVDQNNAFDPQCSKYNYEKSLFNCSECQSNNQKVNTLFLQMIFVKCLLQTDIKYDPFCSLYQKDTFKCQKCQASRTQVKVQDGVSEFNRCILRTNYDPNCLVYDTSQSCLKCNAAKGYLNVLVEVGDTFQNKCILSARLKQRNCRAYNMKLNCVCDKFIVKVSRKGKIIWKCVANKLDANCDVFFENLKCAKCQTGYQTNANSICVKTKTNGNGGAIIII